MFFKTNSSSKNQNKSKSFTKPKKHRKKLFLNKTPEIQNDLNNNNNNNSNSYSSSNMTSNSNSSPTLMGSSLSSTPNHNKLQISFEQAKFQSLINFVGSYLDKIVQQTSPFGDKEQNKLTFEVCFSTFIFKK